MKNAGLNNFLLGATKEAYLLYGRGQSLAMLIMRGKPDIRIRRPQGLRGRGWIGLRLPRGALLIAAVLVGLPVALRADIRNAAIGRNRRVQPLGAFSKDFHGATAALSPSAKGLDVVWTLTNNGKAVLYVESGCSPGQLDMWATTGKEVRRTGVSGELGHAEPVAPGGIFRVVIRLRRYFHVPTHGTFKVDYWHSVWDRRANRQFRQSPGKLHLGLYLAHDFVNLRSNALVVKISASGKLTWSMPGGGAALKAVNVPPAPPYVARAALPNHGPIAMLSALADAVREANVAKARDLVDRTPAAELILAEIPLAGQIETFCRAVRQHLAFNPAPHLATVYPTVGELDKTLTRLDLKSLNVNGDRASVAVSQLNRALTKWVPNLTLLLRRVHGKWLYCGVAGFSLTKRQLAREKKFDRRLTKIFAGLTVQVNNGKIKTLAQLDRISTAELHRADAWYARPATSADRPRPGGHGSPAAQ